MLIQILDIFDPDDNANIDLASILCLFESESTVTNVPVIKARHKKHM
jgi:hypothetical protein